MARAMLSEPAILVADEPTQGVDVGARAEIYRILREVSAGGVPVVVASSDTLELEGLCDRVIVMSRGKAVATLEGDAVTEERIVHAAISATAHTAEQAARRSTGSSRVTRFIEGDYAPVLVLAAVMFALGAYVLSQNDRYLSDFNINSVMFACAALGFISLGQTFALLLGGIDLSVGPLAGFLVVLASFFVLDGKSPAVWALGFVLMFLCAVGVGLLNGALIRFAKFTPVAATLVTYIGAGRARLHAALRSRRLHRHLGDRRDLHEGRARSRSRSSCSSCARSASSSGSAGRGSACGCARSARTRSRRGGSACPSTGRR